MATCPLAGECAFHTGTLSAPAQAVAEAERRFCDADYGKCARYVVSQAAGADSVPADLMPDMAGRAEMLIAEGETIRFKVDKKAGKGGKVKRS